MRLPHRDDAVSPTGHATGYTWVRAGWSHPALATRTGRLLHGAAWLPSTIAGRLGLPTAEAMLLARHRVIDTLLGGAVDDGKVSQVVELACGLSPRGLTFTRRYGDRLTYLEADLPSMAATKRRLLRGTGPLAPGHRVVAVDAFATDGPTSLGALLDQLDPEKGTAVITEGLINYFGTASVLALWRNMAGSLRSQGSGLYLSDVLLRPAGPAPLGWLGRVPEAATRGRVSLHFGGAREAEAALVDAGFTTVEVRRLDRWTAAAPWATDPATKATHIIAATTT